MICITEVCALPDKNFIIIDFSLKKATLELDKVLPERRNCIHASLNLKINYCEMFDVQNSPASV